MQLVVEHAHQLAPGQIRRLLRRGGRRFLFAHTALGHVGFHLSRQAVGDLVEPRCHGIGFADGAGPPGQHQEGGLEGVLGVVMAVEDPAADAQDQRAVPVQEGCERGLVAAQGEALEQFPVARAGAAVFQHETEMLHHPGHWRRHASDTPRIQLSIG